MKTKSPTLKYKQVHPTRIASGIKCARRIKIKRTKGICLRLSQEEHQRLCEKAKAAGLSASALLRDHLGRAQVYNHKQTQIWFATLLSIRKVLVVLAERSVVFRPSDAVVTIAYLASIARQLEHFGSSEPKYAHKVFQ